MDPNQNPNQENVGGLGASVEASPAPTVKPEGSFGPMVGAIIVIVILIAGALYFWGGKLINEEAPPPANQTSAAAINSTSDSIETIETDLNTAETEGEINLDNL